MDGTPANSARARTVLPMLALGAVVAVGAAGAGGLLLPAGEPDDGLRRVLRLVGLGLAGAGVVMLVVHVRRYRRAAGSGSNVAVDMVVASALLVAGVILALLIVLSLPFSDVTVGDRAGVGSGGVGSDGIGQPPTDAASGGEDGPEDSGTSRSGPAPVDGIVGVVDRETGAIGLLDLDTGTVSLVTVADDEDPDRLGVVGVVDAATGELGIVAEVDRPAGLDARTGGGIDLSQLDLSGVDLDPRPGEPSVDLDRVPLEESWLDLDDVDFGSLDFQDVDLGDLRYGGAGLDPEDVGISPRDLSDTDLDRLDEVDPGTDLDELGRGLEQADTTDADDAPGDDDESDESDQDEEDDDGESDVDWGGIGKALAFAAIVALAFVSVLWAMGKLPRRRSRSEAEPAPAEAQPEPLVDVEEAAAGLTASRDAALDAGTPRDRIRAGYAQLLGALDAAGVGRQAQEAPHEHLHRVLGPLGVRPGPVHRLAELFVLAEFSSRALTEQHRDAAVEALDASLADLQPAAPTDEPVGAR